MKTETAETWGYSNSFLTKKHAEIFYFSVSLEDKMTLQSSYVSIEYLQIFRN